MIRTKMNNSFTEIHCIYSYKYFLPRSLILRSSLQQQNQLESHTSIIIQKLIRLNTWSLLEYRLNLIMNDMVNIPQVIDIIRMIMQQPTCHLQ